MIIDDPLDCDWITLDAPPNWQGVKSEADKYELSKRGHALTQGQKQPLDRKIDFAVRVIERALQNCPSWAVSYSGGNDSECLRVLFEHLNIKIPFVSSNTRMEEPATIKKVNDTFKEMTAKGWLCVIVYPDKRPGEVWKEGIPLWSKKIAEKARQYYKTGNENHLKSVPKNIIPKIKELKEAGIMVSEKCCKYLKKDPIKKWDKANGVKGHFTGVRAKESMARRLGYIQKGACYYATRHRQWIANPLIHWVKEDVQTFLERNGVEYQSSRNGCVTCGFGCHLAEENNMELLAKSNPKMHAAALDKWGMRKALDIVGIPYKNKDNEMPPPDLSRLVPQMVNK